MMATISYNNGEYFAESFKTFAELRQSEQTCDITINTSNIQIKAHKIVLASASEYFKNAIYGLFLKDSCKSNLDLNEVQYEILEVIVDYMYTGRISINSGNVYDIYKAADYCLMNFVKVMCLEFLLNNLNSENCIKIWIMANNCKYEKLRIAAANTIFSNLEIAGTSSEFLNLSKEELSDLLGFWPENKLFDSIISAALKWVTDKENWEDTLINIFKDMSFTRISDEYLENVLSHNELIKKSFSCNKWMMTIYKEKSKLYKTELAEFKPELKLNNLKQSESNDEFTRFLVDQPIIFMNYVPTGRNKFYKYNRRDTEVIPYNTRTAVYAAEDCKSYKKWIYVVGRNDCKRFAYDKPDNVHESVFDHKHTNGVKTVVLNESMYFFGGYSSGKTGSIIDLNTEQCTSFNLLHERTWPGVTVNDGSIYICGGNSTNIVEHFDPLEGRTTELGEIPFEKTYITYAAALPNQIYCSHYNSCKMMDLRNKRKWVEIKKPLNCGKFVCLFSAYGKLCSVTEGIVWEYNNASECWNNIGNLPPVYDFLFATSFE